MLTTTKKLLDTFRPRSLSSRIPLYYLQHIKIIYSGLSTAMSDKSDLVPGGTDKYVYVQHSTGTEMMTISFEYTANEKTKSFNLYRRADESLSNTVDRIKLNLAKLTKNKKSKKEINLQGDEGGPELDLQLILGDSTVDPGQSKNADFWIDGSILKLNGCPYVVRRNQPQVVLMKLPTTIMKGFITLPFVDVANCDLHECKFLWYRQITSQEHAQLQSDPSFNGTIETINRTYWLKLATGLTYSPTIDDVAHHLKVVCYPSKGLNEGPAYSCLSSRAVELGPSDCPFEKRHSLTTEKLQSCATIRFVTYNILADLYADQDYSRKVLFAHCPAHALEIDYRRQLLLKEIHGYNADIVCLQEVDRREFMKTYEPYFKLVTEHAGVYNTKGGQVGEGVATFFREDRFGLIDTHRTVLSRLIDPTAKGNNVDDASDEAGPAKVVEKIDEDMPQESHKYDLDAHPILDDPTSPEAVNLLSVFEDMRLKMRSKPNLLSRFMNRHTMLQTNLLKFKDAPNTYVIVANTHLYFAPDADHVRLLQGSACVRYIEYMKSYYRRKLVASNSSPEEPTISVIFCGDMNSTPDCGLYKLMHEGKVDGSLKDWRSNENEAVEGGLAVETKLRFSSAYKNIAYTNYTPGFNGCLDYIYYEVDGFDCVGTIPLPDHDDVTATEGIPSDVFPSDHLALIAHLKFKQ